MAKARIAPKAPEVRLRLDPIFASPEKIARRMGLTPDQFSACQRRLYARGFPVPDETTGMYLIEAVDRWAKRQRADLFPELTVGAPAIESAAPRTDWGARFAEAEKRNRNG
ncbi:hypothetical protein [Methylobacterium nigriterrae]|uniref:hypothetical protein n=1 Tax=Methylobacterium nigriterrae TaxID=3127512 RepID=UPI0030135983